MFLVRENIVFEGWFMVKVNLENFCWIFILLMGLVVVRDKLFKFFINSLKKCFLL